MFFIKGQHLQFAGLSLGVGIALLVATQYCTLEALTSPSVFLENSHSEAKDHHHSGEAPAQGDTQETLCCFALQATDITPRIDLHLQSNITGKIYPIAVVSSLKNAFFESTHAISGLSPPAREPTPIQSFYRTTFASHAPPVSLA